MSENTSNVICLTLCFWQELWEEMETFNALPSHKLDSDFDLVHDMSVQDMDVLEIFQYGVDTTVDLYSNFGGAYLHPNEWFTAFKCDKVYNHMQT